MDASFPWVGDAEAVEDAGFGHFHAAGLAGFVVVVALEVEGAVDDKVGQVVGGGASVGQRFAADGFQGDNDVAAYEAAHRFER
jgi:hypothetical protein